jgi:hypothetical protein
MVFKRKGNQYIGSLPLWWIVANYGPEPVYLQYSKVFGDTFKCQGYLTLI